MPELETTKTEPKLVDPTIESRAEEIRKARELPKKPGSIVSIEEWEQWLELLKDKPEAEKRIDVYVYIMHPVCVMQRINPDLPNYLDYVCGELQGVRHLTKEHLANTYGAGTYKLMVNDRDAANRTRKAGDNANHSTYFEVKTTLPYSQYEFKLDPRIVVWDHKDNKGLFNWAVAKGIVDNKGNVMTPQTQQASQPAPQQDMTPMFKLMMEFVTKLSEKDQQEFKRKVGGEDALTKSMGDLMLEKMKQDDPKKQIETMVALITAIKPDNKSDSTLQFMQMMMDSNNKMFTMLMDMSNKTTSAIMEAIKGMKEGPTAATSKVEELSAFLDVADRIAEGRGGGGKRDWKEVAIEKAADVIVPGFQLLSNIFALRAGQKGQVAPNAAPVGNGVMGNAQRQAASMTQQPQQIQQPQQVQEPVQEVNEAQQLIQQFGTIIISNLDKPGEEVGEMIVTFIPNGSMLMATMRRLGVDGIISGAKAVPEFWGQVSGTYGEPHLREWVDSMLRFDEFEEDEEEVKK